MLKGKSDTLKKEVYSEVVLKEPPITESTHESSALTSLKGIPPLTLKKETKSEPEFPSLNELSDQADLDTDIMETFDVISNHSNDSEEINPMISSKNDVGLDEALNKFIANEQISNVSKEILEPSKDSVNIERHSDGLSSLKVLPKLKLTPLNRDTLTLDPIKKPNLNQINKEMLENQLETDVELQETFNRLNNHSIDAVPEPLDLTEDISADEEYNATEDISEINTTDRSVSPRFVSSVVGHDVVEECRPKEPI